MNDTLFEQVIFRKTSIQDHIPSVLMLLGLLIAGFLGILFLGSFGFALFVILCFVAYYQVIPRFRTELEYGLFNQELEISMIYSKSKRKTLVVLNLGSAKCIAPSGSAQLDYYSPTKTYDYSSRMEGANTYEIILNEGTGVSCYLIEPNEEMVKQMKRATPMNMYLS